MADVSQQPSAASGAPGAYTKRRRSPTPPPADPYALPDDEPVYVPLKQRRAQLVEKLSSKGGGGVTAAAEKRKHEEETEEREQRERDEAEARRKKREHQTLLMEAQEVKRQRAIDGAHVSLWDRDPRSETRPADPLPCRHHHHQMRPSRSGKSAKRKRPRSLLRRKRPGKPSPVPKRSPRASSTPRS